MRFAKAGWAAAAAVLLAAGGCDYWNNLVEEVTLTRADLEVTVVDAWTGEAFNDAECRDSLQDIALTPVGHGSYRIRGAATGPYEIRCDHRWYYTGASKVNLPKSGAHDTLRLARRGEPENWYPQDSLRVGIPQFKEGIRFPTDLDWQVTPWDTTRRFRYEWTFRVAKALNHGHLSGEEQLDPESFSPRFRTRASADRGIREGMDTVILNVFSLMKGGQAGYPVGSDTMPFEWVRNRKPFIHFKAPFDSIPPSFKVGCKKELGILRTNFIADDSDGTCASIKVWTQNAPSLKIDTTYPCYDHPQLLFELSRPTRPGSRRMDGVEEYENTLYAEITDDNGEKARDSGIFVTYTNVHPNVDFRILGGGGTYFVGEPITFRVNAQDKDGGIQQLDIVWVRLSDGKITDESWENTEYDPNNNTEELPLTTSFEAADKFLAFGKARDDCGEWETSDTLSFTVQQNNPPVIQFTHPDTLITVGGDSLEVHFKLSVTDPDAAIFGKDSLKSVRIDWDDFTADTIPTHVQSIRAKPYQHKYPMPRLGTSFLIRIHAEDLHRGGADTSLRVP